MAEMAQHFNRLREIPVPPIVKALVEVGRQRFDQQVQRLKETSLFIQAATITKPGRYRYRHILFSMMSNPAYVANGCGLRATASAVGAYMMVEADVKSNLKVFALALIHPIV